MTNSARLVCRLSAGLALTLVLCLVASAAGPRFFPDDPIQQEPITQNVTSAVRYEPDLAFQTLEGLFSTPGGPVDNRHAENVNTIDEVPDGPFYVNRAGRIDLTPEIVARASNTSAGPAPAPWTVVSAKSDGITPGFTIRDSANELWFIKFDPPKWKGMATGSEVVAAKLFWAVGYHTVEYHIAHLQRSSLVLDRKARITPVGEVERAMVDRDVDRLLSSADRDSDGTYRVILSKAAPGRPVGRIRFHGTRADDPNDIVPHQHRRELRGYRVFAAWLNHVDAKGINSIATLVAENGRSFIRQYLLDFGSALGSAAIGPREGWEGYEELIEQPGEIGKRAISFGFRIPEWRRVHVYESAAVGRLPLNHDKWDPRTWAPHTSNGAFDNMRADDAFWAAEKLTYISDAMIDAAVAEGQFGNEEASRQLARVIRERRDRILETYLPTINPVTRPSIENGQLRFHNAAVEAGVAKPPSGYRVSFSTFDNSTDTAKPLTEAGVTGGSAGARPGVTTPVSIALPPQLEAAFIKAQITATGGPAEWEKPVSVYFRRAGEGWQLVGLERMP
jgi:hypothetical protein